MLVITHLSFSLIYSARLKENKTHKSKNLKEEFGRALMSTLLPEVPTGNSGVNDITSMFELY